MRWLHKSSHFHHRSSVHDVKSLYRMRMICKRICIHPSDLLEYFLLALVMQLVLSLLFLFIRFKNLFIISYFFFSFVDHSFHVNIYMSLTSEEDRSNDWCIDRPVFVNTWICSQPISAQVFNILDQCA
jgi:hypothetical protein